MEASELVEIEAIKQLKARYFRLLDTKRWEDWALVFTEDAQLRWGPGPSEVAQGRRTIVETVSGYLKDAVTCHHGHMPEIELLGESRARGVWAMFDLVDHPDFLLRGYGHYDEEYLKEDDEWRIRSTVLTRLREERRQKAGG